MLSEEFAFRHAPKVVFMEKFARVGLLAQTAEPMFANNTILSSSGWHTMLIGTGRTQQTCPFHVVIAHRPVWVETIVQRLS